MGAHKPLRTRRQEESNGEKGFRDKEGHLGFGDIDPEDDGGVEESIRIRLKCGTIE